MAQAGQTVASLELVSHRKPNRALCSFSRTSRSLPRILRYSVCDFLLPRASNNFLSCSSSRRISSVVIPAARLRPHLGHTKVSKTTPGSGGSSESSLRMFATALHRGQFSVRIICLSKGTLASYQGLYLELEAPEFS